MTGTITVYPSGARSRFSSDRRLTPRCNNKLSLCERSCGVLRERLEQADVIVGVSSPRSVIKERLNVNYMFLFSDVAHLLLIMEVSFCFMLIILFAAVV